MLSLLHRGCWWQGHLCLVAPRIPSAHTGAQVCPEIHLSDQAIQPQFQDLSSLQPYLLLIFGTRWKQTGIDAVASVSPAPISPARWGWHRAWGVWASTGQPKPQQQVGEARDHTRCHLGITPGVTLGPVPVSPGAHVEGWPSAAACSPEMREIHVRQARCGCCKSPFG